MAEEAIPEIDQAEADNHQTNEDLRHDFDREFINGEIAIADAVERGNKNIIRDLLNKFKPLLASDIKMYSHAIGRLSFLKYDPEYVTRLVEIGKPYLDTENARKFISITMSGIGEAQDYLNDENLKELAKKEFQKVLSLIKKRMEEDPVALVSVLKSAAKYVPDLVAQIDRSNLKGKTLNDADFCIISKTATLPDWDPEVAVQTATEILLNSKERPFQSLPEFIKIAEAVLGRYKTHKNDALVDMVLLRGDSFINEDAQTAERIAAMIAESGYGEK